MDVPAQTLGKGTEIMEGLGAGAVFLTAYLCSLCQALVVMCRLSSCHMST